MGERAARDLPELLAGWGRAPAAHRQLRAGEFELVYAAPEGIDARRAAAGLAGLATDRRGRGALHQPMGPRLPPGLPESGGAQGALRRAAGAGPDRHRDPRVQERHRRPAGLGDRWTSAARSSGPTSSCTPSRRARGPGVRDTILRLVRARRGERHHLLPVPQVRRGHGRVPGPRGVRAPAYHAGPDAGGARRGPGRLQPRRPRRDRPPPSPSAWASTSANIRYVIHRDMPRSIGGLLPGDRPRRARRRARGLRAVLLLGRRDLTRSAHRQFRCFGLGQRGSAAPRRAPHVRSGGHRLVSLAAPGGPFRGGRGGVPRIVRELHGAGYCRGGTRRSGADRGRGTRAAPGIASNPLRGAQAGSGGRAPDVVEAPETRKHRTRTCSSACARFASDWRTNAKCPPMSCSAIARFRPWRSRNPVRPMGCSKSMAWGRRSWTSMARRSWPRSPGRDEACALAWTARQLRIAGRSTVQAWSDQGFCGSAGC